MCVCVRALDRLEDAVRVLAGATAAELVPVEEGLAGLQSDAGINGTKKRQEAAKALRKASRATRL